MTARQRSLPRPRVRAGLPERLPLYGDGQTVRFAALAADLRSADGSLRQPQSCSSSTPQIPSCGGHLSSSGADTGTTTALRYPPRGRSSCTHRLIAREAGGCRNCCTDQAAVVEVFDKSVP